MFKAVEEILATLPILTTTDKQKVEAALRVLGTSEKQVDEESSEQILWEQLVSVGKDRGISLPPFSRIAQTHNFSQYKKDAKAAAAFIEGQINPSDRTVRLHAMKLCARALIARLLNMRLEFGLELTPTVVMRQIVNIPAAVESQWPGGKQELCFVLTRQGEPN